MTEVHTILDARGLKCPLPVLKLEKQLAGMNKGARVIVLADDPIARIDIPVLCRKGGHECTITETETHLSFEISKA